MTDEELQSVTENVDRLERESKSLSPRDAELLVLGTLVPLLREDGYVVRSTPTERDAGIDFVAERGASSEQAATSIGIEYKHYGLPVGAVAVRDLLGAGMVSGFSRLLLITNSQFSAQARRVADRELPVALELIGLPDLRAWVSRVGLGVQAIQSRVVQAITDLSRRLAHFIADDPRSLWEIEWRDLERVLAEVFDGIGFAVELTPGSKDHGKDLVLECRITGEKQTYIVEVKHWRSGKRVGKKSVTDFVNVVAREQRHGGLFVSSSGYSEEVEVLAEIEREHVKLGSDTKIAALCRTYKKQKSGIWSAPEALPEVLFSDTR